MSPTYTAEQDPLCYPGTDVLINKADLRDPDELTAFELEMTMTRAEEPLPVGILDFQHYRALHHHLFQDVYDWAGQLREIRIGKGNAWFCYPEYIAREMTRIFDELAAAGHLANLDRPEFAHFISEINAVHPFREGNGRTQFAFLILLAENAGHGVDLDGLDPDAFLGAMIRSFQGHEEPLAQVIETLLR